MAIIGVNQPGAEPQKESGLDKVLKGIQIAQGLMGTALAVPKFIQERKEFQSLAAQRQAQVDVARANLAPVSKEQQQWFREQGVPEAAMPRNIGQAMDLAGKFIETPAQEASRKRADAALEQTALTNKLLMSKEGREKIKFARELEQPVLTPAELEADKKFAADYAEYVPGGGSTVVKKNISVLKDSIQKLRDKTKNLTGSVVGRLPGQDVLNPEAQDLKDNIEAVVQSNMRQLLGPQFTEKEGIMVMQRAFNPRLEEEENARRLEILVNQMEDAKLAKDSAASYFQKNGTLKGYKGKIFGPGDFLGDAKDPAIENYAQRYNLTYEQAKKIIEKRQQNAK